MICDTLGETPGRLQDCGVAQIHSNFSGVVLSENPERGERRLENFLLLRHPLLACSLERNLAFTIRTHRVFERLTGNYSFQ